MPYHIRRNSPLVWLSLVLMLLSAGFRAIYYLRFYMGAFDVLTVGGHILLPLLCNLCFAAFLPTLGQGRIGWTALPVWLGCLFFIIKATGFATWHMLLCCLLYLLVGVLYSLTVLGKLPNRWPALLVFGLPLLFHIVSDLFFAAPRPFPAWMLEISVLLVMASLLFAILALEKENLADEH